MYYKIVTSQEVAKVEEEVNNLLIEGWQLNGPLSLATYGFGEDEYRVFYAQSLVKLG